MKRIPFFILVFFILTSIISHFFVYLNQIFFPADILRGLPIFDFSPVAIKNSLLADPVFQFEPWRVFLKQEIISGNLPFWNGLNGAGVPFIANPQVGVFSPLNIFYYIFIPSVSLIFISLSKISLFIGGTYMYLRQIKISKAISIIGCMSALSGYFLLWLNWPQTSVYLLFPFVLVIIEKAQIKLTFFKFLLLSLVFFIAFLSGHPETYFQISLVGFLYTLFKYFKNWKLIIYYCTGVLVGTLLAGFLLIPFLEYLYYSFALQIRNTHPQTALSLKTAVFSLFPYILGAPHLKFYRPFDGSNFQEASGGYVGIIFIVLVFTKIKSVFADTTLRTWFGIFIISFLLSYSIPILSDLIKLTPLGLNANSRMVATLGFSIIVMGIYLVDKVSLKKFGRIGSIKLHGFVLVFFAFIALVLYSNVIAAVLGSYFSQNVIEFIHIFITLVSINLITTVCFFLAIKLKGRISNALYYPLVSILILVQSVAFFAYYNPFVSTKNYYPKNDAIKILQYSNLPILNVGNVNLSPDINMVYGIKSVENYDALDVSWYKKAFDLNFPDKNRWGNVDSVNLSSLRRFGVGNVISDYDINLEKVSYSNRSDKVLSLQNKIEITLVGNGKVLRQIRFIPATYNRENRCNVSVTLKKNKEILERAEISCSKLYNGMFYTITLNPQFLEQGEQYRLGFETHKASSQNYIGLFGNGITPYLDILFDSGNSHFERIYERHGVSIYRVPNSEVIESSARIRILSDENGKLVFVADSLNPTTIQVKKTYYPGWRLKINNLSSTIEGRDPFMKISIPRGKAYIELEYIPYSFYVGIIISGAVFFIIVSTASVILLRGLIKSKFIKNNYAYINSRAVKLSESTHVYIFSFAFLVSLAAFILLCTILPFKFQVPETTAINWLTVHKYPKQQDIYVFAFGFTFIVIFSFLIWIMLICRKK